jgi:hypothetical protein
MRGIEILYYRGVKWVADDDQLVDIVRGTCKSLMLLSALPGLKGSCCSSPGKASADQARD